MQKYKFNYETHKFERNQSYMALSDIFRADFDDNKFIDNLIEALKLKKSSKNIDT
jgi:hypothetical protein